MDIRRWAMAVAPVAAAAGLGGLGARNAPRTYGRLRKPVWAPPAGAFGPVWSALYVGIGAAGWRLSGSASTATKGLHLAQLALNAAWPLVFFTVRDKRASLAVIGLLDAAVAAEHYGCAGRIRSPRCCCCRTWPGAASPPRSTRRSATPATRGSRREDRRLVGSCPAGRGRCR